MTSVQTNNAHLEQYKAYVQDLGNIGIRHENSRRFYLSVVSALFVFVSMAGPDGLFAVVKGPILALVGGVGVVLCLLWIVHMQAFSAIFKAKFEVLRKMEMQFGFFHVFDEEYELLKKDARYHLLTVLDAFVALLFACLFIAVLQLQ